MPLIPTALAQSQASNEAINSLNVAAGSAGFNPENADAFFVIGVLLSYLLGLLGIVLVIYIVWGGILYITSQGEAEKAKKGMKMITNAIIGIVIILAAYGIATYLINILTQVF